MTVAEISGKVKEIRELRRLIEDAQAVVDSLQDEIKAEMTAQETEILTGDTWKITWKTITSKRIDTTALKKALPDIAEQFSKISTSKRFTLA